MAQTLDAGYFLQVSYGNGQPSRVMTVPLVTHYEPKLRPSQRIDWTIGGLVKQKSEPRSGTIVIRGSAGNEERTGHSATGAEIRGLGHYLFDEFIQFIHDYWKEGATTEGAITRNEQIAPHLVFLAIDEGEAWPVEIDEFVPIRETQQSRLSRSYTLVLSIEGPPLRRSPLQDAALQLETLQVAAAPAAAAGPEASPAGPVAEASGILETLSPIVAEVRPSIEDGVRALTVVQGWLASRDSITVESAGSLVDKLRASSRTLEAVWAGMPPLARAEARGTVADVLGLFAAVEQKATHFLAIAGSLRREPGPDTVGSPAGWLPAAPKASVVATARSGETLLDVARRELGDEARWTELADLNGMTSPWDLQPGDPVKIPAPQGILATGTDVFGTDFRVRDGTLVLVETEDGCFDFAAVSGPDNYRQACRIRVTTRRGANKAAPWLGLDDSIGSQGTASRYGQIAFEVRDQLLRDSRTKDVRELELTPVADRVGLQMSLRPITGSPIPVSMSL